MDKLSNLACRADLAGPEPLVLCWTRLAYWHFSCILLAMAGTRISAALRALCVVALVAFCGSSVRAASDWQVIKVGPRDYLTLENVAKFYGFPPPQPSGPQGKTVNMDNGRIQLAVTLEGREAIINGVRNWLSFPI